jgi:hypothetical protein
VGVEELEEWSIEVVDASWTWMLGVVVVVVKVEVERMRLFW